MSGLQLSPSHGTYAFCCKGSCDAYCILLDDVHCTGSTVVCNEWHSVHAKRMDCFDLYTAELMYAHAQFLWYAPAHRCSWVSHRGWHVAAYAKSTSAAMRQLACYRATASALLEAHEESGSAAAPEIKPGSGARRWSRPSARSFAGDRRLRGHTPAEYAAGWPIESGVACWSGRGRSTTIREFL